jgi:hypothetical protein
MPEKKRIVIEGGVAFIERTTIEKVVSLKTALSEMPALQAIVLPRIPKNCRFYYQENKKIHLVVEIDPGPQFIKTSAMKAGLYLSMPFQYMVFPFSEVANVTYPNIKWRIDDVSLFWSQKRLKTLDQTVIPARLPNVYRDYGRICFGGTAPQGNLELDERVDTIVNQFFTPASVFNADLGWNIPEPYETFREWAVATKADPLVALKWDWWDNIPNEYRAGKLSGFIRFLSFYNPKESITIEGCAEIPAAVSATTPEFVEVEEFNTEEEVWEDFEEEVTA